MKALLRNSYIGVESLRNSYDYLGISIKDRAKEAVFSDTQFATPVDRAGVIGHVDEEALWKLPIPNVPEDKLHELLLVRPRVVDGVLHVSSLLRDMPGWQGRVEAVLLYVWKLRKFTQVRWCGVGTSARGLLGALITGIAISAESCIKNPKMSSYFLNGFHRLQIKERRFIAICAMMSGPCDAVLQFVLDEPRVAMFRIQLEKLIVDQVDALESVSAPIWQLVALTVSPDETASDMMHQSLYASQIAIGYFVHDTLREAQAYPWRLCAQGQEDQELQILKARDEVTVQALNCGVTMNCWDILQNPRLGHSVAKNGTKTLAQASWVTNGAEQSHKAASWMEDNHPDYSPDMFMARTFHLQNVPVIRDRELLREESLVLQLERRLLALEHRCPQRIGGKQVFLKACFERAKSLAVDGKLSLWQIRSIVATHSQRYNELPEEEREGLVRQAKEVERAGSEQRKALAAQQLLERLELLDQQVAEIQAKRGEKTILDNCRWDAAKLEEFAQIYFAPESQHTPEQLRNRRKEKVEGAPRMPEQDALRLKQIDVRHLIPRHPVQPAWVLPMFWNKFECREAVLHLAVADGGYFLFLYAWGRTGREYVAFLPLKRIFPGLYSVKNGGRPFYSRSVGVLTLQAL